MLFVPDDGLRKVEAVLFQHWWITSEIESVIVDKKDNHFHKQVLIKTDQQEEAIGGGLSAKALEWLKNCILSIISA
jgi:hypothetical protein